MPNLDTTGPLGQGPRTGRRNRRFTGGTKECTCPKCSYKQMHQRGIPCTKVLCPKCNTPLRGDYCL